MNLILKLLNHFDKTHQFGSNLKLKGTVISSDPSCKDSNARFTTIILKLIKNVEDTVVFLTWKSFLFVRFSTASYNLICREPAKENKHSKETKTLIIHACMIRQSFQGYRCKSDIATFSMRFLTELGLRNNLNSRLSLVHIILEPTSNLWFSAWCSRNPWCLTKKKTFKGSDRQCMVVELRM